MNEQKTRNLPAGVIVLLCLVGAWISGELLKAHAGPWPLSKAAPTWFTRVCGTGANGESPCTSVLASDWSAVDLDIPVPTRAADGWTIQRSRLVVPIAFMGLAYYVFLGVWFALAGRPRPWGFRWYLVPLLTVIGGTVGSLTLLWVMFFKIGSQCTWCLVTHAINGMLLVGTLYLWPRKAALMAEKSIVRSQDRPNLYARAALTPSAALRTMALALVLIAGLWLYRGVKLDVRRQVARLLPYKRIVQKQRENPAFLLREYYAQPQHVIPPREVLGRTAAGDTLPTLMVFSDFQCPQCACSSSLWEDRGGTRWKGTFPVAFHHFPLNQECNDTVTRAIHPESCLASYAAEAARLQGGEDAFWMMHDLLFQEARRLAERPYAKLAAKIGLDGGQLLADMQSEVVRQTVAADIGLASALGVTGTPSVFLDGRRVPQFCLYNPRFWDAVSSERHRRASAAKGGEPDARPDDHRASKSVASRLGDRP